MFQPQMALLFAQTQLPRTNSSTVSKAPTSLCMLFQQVCVVSKDSPKGGPHASLGIQLPGDLILVHEHSDHYSLQPATEMSLQGTSYHEA